MYSSCKRSVSRNTTWSAIYISLQRNIPKFDAVLLHSNWSSLRRKYLSKIPTDVNALSCGAKTWNISGISDAISPARHPQKSSQHVRACAAGDGAICSKNRIIVPYHGDNPNTWNGARLRSPSPIMAPGIKSIVKIVKNFTSVKHPEHWDPEQKNTKEPSSHVTRTLFWRNTVWKTTTNLILIISRS